MSVHRFEPEFFYNTIGAHSPVLHISDGDSVFTNTIDAHGLDKKGDTVAKRGNPMTGPFYIEGAEPGDALAIYLDYIYPNRNWGWTANATAVNVVEPQFIQNLNKREILRWDINLQDGIARISEVAPPLDKLKFSLAPFMGCFGVAPSQGQTISTETSGNYGGNMDYRGFVAGTIVYFPIFVEGALLHFGDGHAFQGDGEILGTGLEVSMDIRFTVKLIKQKKIRWPRGESATHIFTVGNARPLEQAVQHATTEMLHWLTEDYNLSMTEANILLGQCVEYELGNIYNPAYTMVCKVKKAILSEIGQI